MTSAQASLTSFPNQEDGDIVRFDFVHSKGSWDIGQHFYLCFPRITPWQSHPFTPLSLPRMIEGGYSHSYIFRAKGGETHRLALTARAHPEKHHIPVVLSGPYGQGCMRNLSDETNILCIAGGTGITFVLPILLDLIRKPSAVDRQMTLIWAMRRSQDQEWVARELDVLSAARAQVDLKIHFFVTRSNKARGKQTLNAAIAEKDVDTSSESDAASSNGEVVKGRPDLAQMIPDFLSSTVRGRTSVFASGPGSMLSDVRHVVAACNSGSKVWRGDERMDVDLTCDDRQEW